MGTHTRITVQTDAGTLVAIHFRESDEGAAEEEMVDQEVHVCGIHANQPSLPPATKRRP